MKVVLVALVTIGSLIAAPCHAQSKPADQCLDGICIYDDVGSLAGINWSGFGASTPAQADRAEIGRCAESNKTQWKGNANRLCGVMLTRGSKVTAADYVKFFAQNSGPVCEPYQSSFEIELPTPLGSTFAAIKITQQGRPAIAGLRKNFSVKTPQEHAQLRALLEKKHPYSAEGAAQRGKAVWGGVVYLNFTPNNTVVDMSGDESRFVRNHGSVTTGGCANEQQPLTVK